TRVRMVVIGVPLFCNSLCYWQGDNWCVAANCASAKKAANVAINGNYILDLASLQHMMAAQGNKP
ncbi:MAG TPA: hypothetical protein VLM18_05380, partial [Croceibacterium sp.]|nr:hypothetical protein [Croceibacterium sp.]